MYKILLMTMLSLTLIACDRQDKPNNRPPSEQGYNNDNTGKNIRDRDSMAKTPLDQSESEADRTITQKIRQAIMSDGASIHECKKHQNHHYRRCCYTPWTRC